MYKAIGLYVENEENCLFSWILGTEEDITGFLSFVFIFPISNFLQVTYQVIA